jgi:Rieske Fe-S protein
MNRRNFLGNICKAGFGVAIGGSLIDLANVKSIKARSRLGPNDVREIPLNLIDTPDLKHIGGTYHLSVDDLEREILVVHVASDQYVAVDIKCTHRGCDVNYDSDAKIFECPCHGSTFSLKGAVTKGPATKPLGYYHAERKGDEVIVTVYGIGDTPPANCIPPQTIPQPEIQKLSPKDSTVIDSLIKSD